MSRPIPLLLAGSLFLALALAPVHAGSQQDPEVTDLEHDISLAGTVPGCVTVPDTPQLPTICIGDAADETFAEGLGGDIVRAWIDHENTTSFQVTIETHEDPARFMDDPAGAGSAIAAIRLTVAFSINGLAETAIASYDKEDGMATVGGVATAVSHDGAFTSLTVPRSVFGNVTAGRQLTNLTVLGESLGLGPGSPDAPSQAPADPAGMVQVFTDNAPENGTGRPYTFTLSSQVSDGSATGGGNATTGAPGCTYRSGEANRTDRDADCLPDHWEAQHFGGTAAQDAAGDPDGDGCSNRCEYLHGTDPNKKDSDGDGAGDGDEVNAGTNPANPASRPSASGPAGTTTTAPPGGGTTTSRTSTGTTTTSRPSTSATGAGASPTSPSALDKIQADSGYAVASGAAMGTVVLISLIGLFGRWGA